MTSVYETALFRMKSAYAAGVGVRDLLQKQLTAKETELTQAKEDITVWEQIQTLFAKVSEYAREQLKTRIEETVTAALVTVFGYGYTFRVNLRTVGGQPAAEWQVISQYGDYEVTASPEESRGGGIVDVISIALRLALLELVRPKPGGPVIFDEAAKMVSREYLPNLAYFLKQYAVRTGRQIVLITHAEQLAEAADKSYIVALKNGESEVKAI